VGNVSVNRDRRVGDRGDDTGMRKHAAESVVDVLRAALPCPTIEKEQHRRRRLQAVRHVEIEPVAGGDAVNQVAMDGDAVTRDRPANQRQKGGAGQTVEAGGDRVEGGAQIGHGPALYGKCVGAVALAGAFR